MNRILPPDKFVFTNDLSGQIRPLSAYDSFAVAQDGVGGKFFVRASRTIGGNFNNRITPERDTFDEARADLLKLFAAFNGENFVAAALPADPTELNI